MVYAVRVHSHRSRTSNVKLSLFSNETRENYEYIRVIIVIKRNYKENWKNCEYIDVTRREIAK